MTEREANISELQRSAAGKKLLNFVSDVNLSIHVEDKGDQLVARFGGPNELTTIRDSQAENPAGTGADLDSALSSLFNKVRFAPLIKSAATQPRTVTYVGRVRDDGHFTTGYNR